MIDLTWLNDYIEQMEYEVQENKDDSKYYGHVNQPLYHLAFEHGEQKGVLDTLKLIKGKLDEE